MYALLCMMRNVTQVVSFIFAQSKQICNRNTYTQPQSLPGTRLQLVTC